MKIVTAGELLLRQARDNKRKEFETFITLLKLGNESFTDDDYLISTDGQLEICVDERWFDVDGMPLYAWLSSNATGTFDSDKYLYIDNFN
jgi:hypothetical protein